MSIRIKLLASFLAVLLLAAAQGVFMLNGMNRVGALSIDMFEKPLMSVNMAHAAAASFKEANLLLRETLEMDGSVDWEAATRAFRERSDGFITDLGILEERALSDASRQEIAAVRAAATQWRDQAEALLGGSGQPIVALTNNIQFGRLQDSVAEHMDLLVEHTLAEGYEFRVAAERQIASQRLQALVTVGLIFAAGVAVALGLAANLVPPVRNAVRIAEAVARGDFRADIEARRRDEIGSLLKALRAMQAALKERAESEARRSEEKAAEAARRAQRQERLDQLTRTFGDRVDALLGTVDQATGAMRGNAESMAGMVTETGRQAGLVAEAATRTSANTQAVSAATEELAASIGGIRQQMMTSSEAAGRAVTEAGRTSEAVRGLDETAQQVGTKA